MEQNPEPQYSFSVFSAFRFIGWFISIVVPWACAFVLFHWIWAPEWHSNLCLWIAGIFILLLGIAIWLFVSWKLTAENKTLRIVLLVLVPLNFLMGSCYIAFNDQPYNPIVRTHSYRLGNEQYTFYVQEFRTWGTFLTHDGVTRIWVRKGDAPTLMKTGDAVSNVAHVGDPVVNGDKVIFYFRDESILQKQGDQYLEYEASTGYMYHGYADSIPVGP